MPRKQEIKATDVLAYFETAAIENATLVSELATGIVKRRKGKTTTPATATTTAAPATAAATNKPRRARNAATGAAAPTVEAPAATVSPGLPGMAPVGGGA